MSIVDEGKFIRLLWTCSRFGLSPFWPYPDGRKSRSGWLGSMVKTATNPNNTYSSSDAYI